jgi:hypothetical protein
MDEPPACARRWTLIGQPARAATLRADSVTLSKREAAGHHRVRAMPLRRAAWPLNARLWAEVGHFGTGSSPVSSVYSLSQETPRVASDAGAGSA